MGKKEKRSDSNEDMLIVGLGASAGGLQALKAFFKLLPDKTGMAFIVIIHLSPEHKSNLAELLQAETSLQVLQVNERVDIKDDHVYVIPPSKLLKVGDDHIELSDPESLHSHASIDYLFRSLGEVKGRNAAGVILSGAGSDGTVGLKTIKENGGISIVQEPKEAQYTEMPWSAIDSGVVDFVLPVQNIGEQLLKYMQSLSEIRIPEVKDGEEKILNKIFTRVRSKTGHDFSSYKRSSVLRRIERRMQVNQVKDLTDYLGYLQKNPEEIDDLFKDLLISVTHFFRDEQAFKALEEKIIPQLFEDKNQQDQVRVWVSGCATGEEAYSIAMLLKEHAHQLDDPPDIQLFASDIDEAALSIARQGSYPDSIGTDVSEERLNRFFTHTGNQYQLKEELRSIILFAPHNLLSNPPFSKLDLVACRNLLIYLNKDLQKEVFNLFHYALQPQGYLFIGLSDSNLEASEMFRPVNKKLRIYRRTPSSNSHLRIPQTHLQSVGNNPKIPYYNKRLSRGTANYEALHRNLLARLYAPQSVIINKNYQVIHATDSINKFLEYAGGEPSHNIMQMVMPEIRQTLQSLLLSAEKNPAQHLRKKTLLHTNKGKQQIEIIVHQISDSNFSEGLIHVIFKEISAVAPDHSAADKNSQDGEVDGADEIIDVLEQELNDTKEQLQITVEKYETSNEELRASNEELQSMNEELQSTTEELVTSKEELQSVNEELKAVNLELEDKVENLDQANSDLKNLMEASEIGIIFVDRELCVQRFTSHATHIFNLIDSDKGRPLEHVTHQLDYDSVVKDVKQGLKDLKHTKKVVSGNDGNSWYIMRVRPYRTTDGGVKGIVLTFVEITQLKQAQARLDKKARQEEALAQLGLYALNGTDHHKVVHRAAQIICEILQIDYCLVHKFNEDDHTFELIEALGEGFEGDCPEDVVLNVETKWDIGFAFENESLLKVENYKKENRFGLLPYLESQEICGGVNVMVEVEGPGKAYGVLSAYSQAKRTFSKHDINFLRVIANLLGESMDRKQANEELKESNERLQKEIKKSEEYQREILSNSVAERWELGGYLHDNLAQILVSVKIMVNDLCKKLPDDNDDGISKIDEIIDEGIAGIRNLTHDVIPIDIEEEGVSHAFRLLMRQNQKLYDIHCRLETEEIINEIKNVELATNLYHIIQEAIKNAALHGKAENIKVSVCKPNGALVLKIMDDGIGLSHSTDESDGRGLHIMKYRIELLGGTFAIEDLADSGSKGTLITCTMPLEYLTEKK